MVWQVLVRAKYPGVGAANVPAGPPRPQPRACLATHQGGPAAPHRTSAAPEVLCEQRV
jgi:hypothetical protein